MSRRTIAIVQALFVTFLWSTSWVLIKFGLEDVPPLTFAGLRYFLAFILLLPLVWQRRNRAVRVQPLTRADWAWLSLLGLVYYAITQGAQFVALSLLPAVTISLMLNFTTVVVAFLGIVFLSEQPRLLQWVGTVLFVLGALLYFWEEAAAAGLWRTRGEFIGFVVAAVGVLANAVSSIVGRGINRAHRIPALYVTVISMGIGSVTLIAAGLLLQGLPQLGLTTWLLILWLALINTAFAFTLWNQTLRTLSAMESSIINSTMLLQIALLAWVFLGERLDLLEVAGLFVAGSGALIVQLRRLPSRERANVGKEEPL